MKAAEATVDFRELSDTGARLRAAGRYDEAEATLREAVRLSVHPIPARNLGNLLRLLGRLDGAEAAYREALRRDPDHVPARVGLAYAQLGLGRYAEGWETYEARRCDINPPVAPGREWNGEDLAGKSVLLWPEQGLGDQIMCARFAQALRERGADVTVAASAALLPLLPHAGLRAAPIGHPPKSDYSLLMFSAPRLLGVTVDGIPAPLALRVASHQTGGIGVVWRGSPKHENDAERSLPPELGARLLCLPGAIDLSPEDTGAKDLLATARIIAGLDLVVTVDTAVAHLAASMGKPTWILLPCIGTDWRWLQGRSDSPWYPSARLVRQAAPGGWEPVVEQVCDEISGGIITA